MFNKSKHHNINYNTIVFWIILFLSCFVRLFSLGEIPAGIHQDEGLIGYNAYTLLTTGADSWGNNAPIYLIGWGSGTSILYVLLTKLCFYLYGINIWALRLTQAIVGCIGCYVFYKLLKLFYNKQTALLGFFLICIMPWSIMNSRWALDSNIAPIFWLLGFYFYCHANKKNTYLFLSAIFYALTMYAYAGYWLFILLTLPLQYIYLCWQTKNKETYINTALSSLIFIAMIIPLGWLILINYGWLNEYKSNWLTIPKLLFWRGNEVGLENLPLKLTMLYKVFILQNDGWLSNTIPTYGLFYLFTPVFMLIGILALIKGAREDLKTKRFSLNLCILLQILIGFIYGSLIYAFSNRVNFLFFPLVIAATLGISNLKPWRYLYYFIIIIYISSFVCFSHTYFLKYNDMLDKYTPFSFSNGLAKALAKADEIHQINKAEIYILENPYAYAKVLFYRNISPQQYLQTVHWHAYPDPFIQAQHFLYFNFVKILDFNNLNKKYIYIVHKDNHPHIQDMIIKTYGNYIVAYKE